MKTYSGKTSLVTGASVGIGKAFAAALAQRGSHLVLVARSKDRLEALAAELRTAHRVRVEVIAADLAEEGAAARVFQAVTERGLSVDLLVNNAGFGKWGNFLNDDLPTLAEMMNLNMRALVELCHVFLPSMEKKGDCAILNLGSTGSFVSLPWSAIYAATKAFVLSFSEALSYEYRDRGVHVSVLCPGATQSNFAAVASSDGKVQDGKSMTAESVVEIGLDALLQGKVTIVPGRDNQLVAFLPRVLSRERVVKTAGETWKKRLASRGLKV